MYPAFRHLGFRFFGVEGEGGYELADFVGREVLAGVVIAEFELHVELPEGVRAFVV